MLTKINDIEKLPKIIKRNKEIYYLFLDTEGKNLFIGYANSLMYAPIIIEIGKFQENIDEGIGYATTLKEAVNMLYEYVMNNPEIKVEY